MAFCCTTETCPLIFKIPCPTTSLIPTDLSCKGWICEVAQAISPLSVCWAFASLSLSPFFSLSILSPNLTPSFLGLIENVIHKRSEKDYTYGTGYDVSGYTYFIFLRGKKPNVLNFHVSLKIFTWSLYLLASKSAVLIVLEGNLISHVQCSCGHTSVSHPRTTVWGSPLTLPLRWHLSETAKCRCQPGHALIYLRTLGVSFVRSHIVSENKDILYCSSLNIRTWFYMRI